MDKTSLDQFATGLDGTRSSCGHCRNTYRPVYPSDDSSAGFALVVTLDVASFVLGTDTAGSGRVPAGLNNLVGLKATKGVIFTVGIVPACRMLDCVTSFSATADEANQLLVLITRTDPQGSCSRRDLRWSSRQAFGRPSARFRFGVPQTLNFLGCRANEALFVQAAQRLTALGGVPAAIDFTPFLAAVRLLYGGPWVAKRHAVAGPLTKQQPDVVSPVVHDALVKTPDIDATATFKAMYRLQGYKAQYDVILDMLDCVLTPTFPRPVTLDELTAEPIARNAGLGYYINFVNLLDYMVMSVSCEFMPDGLPPGVTLFGQASTDQYLLSLIGAFQRAERLSLAGGTRPESSSPVHSTGHDQMALAVCSAHLAGLPLNSQLLTRGGRLLQATHSASCYRLYTLADGRHPAMMRDEHDGAAITVEVWKISNTEMGSLLVTVPTSLGLEQIELADGRWATGSIREVAGLGGATEIIAWDGWRQRLIR